MLQFIGQNWKGVLRKLASIQISFITCRELAGLVSAIILRNALAPKSVLFACIFEPFSTPLRALSRLAPPPLWGGGPLAQRISGIENCAPSLMPDGQRAVTVLVLV
jgi:hypothetical protein